MIKRIRFVPRRPGAEDGDACARLPRAERGAAAPSGVRPLRVAVAVPVSVPGMDARDARYGGVVTEWFADPAHLERHRSWRRGREALSGRDAGPPVVVLAEEVVVRGADWLDARWREGGERLKHMALAVRADGLTPAEFSARWKAHAGRLTRPGDGGSVRIPEAAKGRAYVQNHPLPGTGAQCAKARPYDAVNEVYFDDLAGLRARVGFFAENRPDGAGDALFGRSWTIAVRETVVPVDAPKQWR